jgi:hypothetical protein
LRGSGKEVFTLSLWRQAGFDVAIETFVILGEDFDVVSHVILPLTEAPDKGLFPTTTKFQ